MSQATDEEREALDPLLVDLKKVARWADEEGTKIDLGGPFYSRSNPYWLALRTCIAAMDRIAYLEGKSEGHRAASLAKLETQP
jgi:hypothetical protein